MRIEFGREALEPERPEVVALSVDVTAKSDRPTRWVLTTTDGYSELVHEVSGLSAVDVADLTHILAVAYDADRVLIRSYGIGAGIADILSTTVPEKNRKYEVWTVYPGRRKVHHAEG